jgi:hypothetical protein
MSTLRDAMRALGAGLTAAVQRTAQIEHALTKGEARETALREQLRPHIPKRYGVSSGIVVNLAGEQSRQQDVIVSDAVENPPFIAEGVRGTSHRSCRRNAGDQDRRNSRRGRGGPPPGRPSTAERACATPRLQQLCPPRGRDRRRSPSCALTTTGATDRRRRLAT